MYFNGLFTHSRATWRRWHGSFGDPCLHAMLSSYTFGRRSEELVSIGPNGFSSSRALGEAPLSKGAFECHKTERLDRSDSRAASCGCAASSRSDRRSRGDRAKNQRMSSLAMSVEIRRVMSSNKISHVLQTPCGLVGKLILRSCFSEYEVRSVAFFALRCFIRRGPSERRNGSDSVVKKRSG